MPSTPFTRREEYRLISLLSDAYPGLEDAKAVFDRDTGSGAVLNRDFSKIPTGDPTSSRWRNLYDNIVNETELIKLLDFVIGESEPLKAHQTITDFLSVLQTRDQNKLTKLAEAIRNNTCILFLGPSALRTWDGQPFNKLLANALANILQQNTNDIYFDPDQRDNLSYIAQRYEEIARKQFHRKFPGQKYSPQQVNEQGQRASDVYTTNRLLLNSQIYQDIARLPFKIIINTNPNYKELVTAIDATTDRQCIHGYFSMANGNAEGKDDRAIVRDRMAEFAEPKKREDEKDKVLLYNLFGSLENPYSILTTESQLLHFTTIILDADAGLHFELKREFFDPKYYLFLGFDFDQWYAKIIFNTVLKLDKSENHTVSLFPLMPDGTHNGAAFSQTNREFFEEEFNMYFVTNAMETFLDKLITTFTELPDE